LRSRFRSAAWRDNHISHLEAIATTQGRRQLQAVRSTSSQLSEAYCMIGQETAANRLHGQCFSIGRFCVVFGEYCGLVSCKNSKVNESWASTGQSLHYIARTPNSFQTNIGEVFDITGYQLRCW